MKNTCKYTIKKPFSIAYIILICVCLILTGVRWYSIFNNDVVIINPVINSHISNLSLSILLYLTAGFGWLALGVKFRFIIFLGVFFVASNLICETVMGFINTADIIDAVYGIVGTAIGFAYLYITNKYGLVPINADKTD